MHFASEIYRPPYEANIDEFLQVTSGCSHNSCAFCPLYRAAKFRVSPNKEIIADLKELQNYKSYGANFSRIFLQGANAFVLSYDRLMEIRELIREYLPDIENIGGYARVDDVSNKSIEQLRALKNAGFQDFFFGIETGDENLLRRMNKGYYSNKFVVEQMSKLDKAGMTWTAAFLGGLGGHKYGFQHADETAKLLNQLRPKIIFSTELTLMPKTQLYEDVQTGKYEEADEEERLIEMQEFIRQLTVKTFFWGAHSTIPVPILGKIPNDKEKLIQQIQEVIETADFEMLRYRRKNIRQL